MVPLIEQVMFWLQVSALALPEDLCPVKLPATGTGPTGEPHVCQDSTDAPTAMQLDSSHIDTTGCEVFGSSALKVWPE